MQFHLENQTMPELPEVETIRRALQKLAIGLTVKDYQLLREDYLRTGKELLSCVQGGKIVSFERRGKILAIRLDNKVVLLHHLGMSGRLLFYPTSKPLDPHVHLRIIFQEIDFEIRQYDPRRFGYIGLGLASQLDQFEPWSKMGEDPFNLKPMRFHKLLQNRNRPVKSLLLEQHIIGGMGNIYVDESLFRAKIHPLRKAWEITLPETRCLLKHIRNVLNESIAAGGSSTNDYQKLDGTLGEFQHKHRVYNRQGLPCKTCGSLVEKIILSGRGTHFCPYCQK